jgi:hypothetical protein
MSTPSRPALLTPSLGNATKVPADAGTRPWHLQSMFYVAFFGGPMAITWIAYQNAKRLDTDPALQQRIAIAGAVVCVVIGVLVGALLADLSRLSLLKDLFPDAKPTQMVRILVRVCAVVLYLLFLRWLTPAYRRYIAFGGGEFDSLWKPGFAAAMVGDLAILAVALGTAALLAGVSLATL